MTIRLPDEAGIAPFAGPIDGGGAEAPMPHADAAAHRRQAQDDTLFVATALADLAARHGAALHRAENAAFAGDLAGAAGGFAQGIDSTFVSDVEGILSAAAAMPGARPSDDALESLRNGAGEMRRALVARAALGEAELHRFRQVQGATAALDGLSGLVAADPDALPQADAHLAALTAAAVPLFGEEGARRLHAVESVRLAGAALRGLIAADPDAAIESLSSGLFDGRLDRETRDRLAAEATLRRDALAADSARMQRNGLEAAERDAAARAWAFARDFDRRIAAGEASEAALAAAESAGLVSPTRAAALRAALAHGEAQRAAAAVMARHIGDLLDRGVAPDPSSSHARAAVDRHWRMVVEPAFDGRPAEDRIAGIGDYVSRTHILPEPALKLLVSALFDGEGDTRAAAAQALSAAAAADPASAALIAAPILDRARESAALAQAGLPAGLAVQPLDEIAGDMRTRLDPVTRDREEARATMMGERTPPLAGTFGIAQMHGTAAPAPTQHEKALTKRERFSQFRENLRPREGGFTDDPDDDGGPTNKGVSQDLLDLLLEKPQWQHLPKKTVDLTDEQIDAILWSEFFERPKIDQLARVPGLAAAAPNFAEQIFDSGVTSNTAAVGRFLQKALDAVLGTDLRVVKEDGTRDYDGNIGPATRTAVEMAVRKEKIAEVNNRVVDIRSEYFRELVRRNPWKKKYLDGWLKRAESFRMR